MERCLRRIVSQQIDRQSQMLTSQSWVKANHNFRKKNVIDFVFLKRVFKRLLLGTQGYVATCRRILKLDLQKPRRVRNGKVLKFRVIGMRSGDEAIFGAF